MNAMPMDNADLVSCIEALALEAARRCGQSHEVYVQKFSGMIDLKFGDSEPALRDAALAIARKHDYSTSEEIAAHIEEIAKDGCCHHGMTADTCPCGCFENY
jgi:hypothetical protein